MQGCLVRYLNNITRISIHFFTYTYFKKIQTTLLEQYYQTAQAITNYVQFLSVNRRIACCLSKILIQFSTLHTCLDTNEMHLCLRFFLFFCFCFEKHISVAVVVFPADPMYCSRDPQTSFSTKLSLKIGLMALFTHLKIILLQYFQFSAK